MIKKGKTTVELKKDADSGQITVLQKPIVDGVRKDPETNESKVKVKNEDSTQEITVLEKPVNDGVRKEPKVID